MSRSSLGVEATSIFSRAEPDRPSESLWVYSEEALPVDEEACLSIIAQKDSSLSLPFPINLIPKTGLVLRALVAAAENGSDILPTFPHTVLEQRIMSVNTIHVL